MRHERITEAPRREVLFGPFMRSVEGRLVKRMADILEQLGKSHGIRHKGAAA